MQILDSLIDGPLELPNEREGDELVGKIVRYLRTGKEPTAKGNANAILKTAWPVLKKSRARIVAGSKGGSNGECEPSSEGQSKRPSKTPSKGASERTSEEEEELGTRNFEEEEGQSPFGTLCLNALNEVKGTSYATLPGKAARRLALMDGKYTVAEVKAMVEYKQAEWAGTKFARHVVPSTLFGEKFEEYMDQSRTGKEADDEWDEYRS